MFSLFQYKKYGLPYGLAKLHQFLLEDIICYFEKGKSTKRRVKEIRRTIKQAIKFARKKKLYPSLKTNKAVELMEEMYDELETTQRILKEAAAEMDALINEIKEERVLNIHSIVTDAQEYFKEKKIDTGITLLQKVENETKNIQLTKTRKKIFGGFDSEIKKIKSDIEKTDSDLRIKENSRFLTLSIPWEKYSSYKMARNFYMKFNGLMN